MQLPGHTTGLPTQKEKLLENKTHLWASTNMAGISMSLKCRCKDKGLSLWPRKATLRSFLSRKKEVADNLRPEMLAQIHLWEKRMGSNFCPEQGHCTEVGEKRVLMMHKWTLSNGSTQVNYGSFQPVSISTRDWREGWPMKCKENIKLQGHRWG